MPNKFSGAFRRPTNNTSSIPLGAGNFAPVSLELMANSLDVRYIPYDKLRVDAANTYSRNPEYIHDLAESIEDIGLQQPLVVVKASDGVYDILAGQCRYLAIKEMIDNGKDTYMNVPCHEVDLDGIKLDISNDLKKEYIIASTNAVREKTDSDRLLDVEKLGKVYAALKREEKKAVGRQRDFIAQATGMAPRTVQNLMTVNKLPEALKEAVTENQVPVNAAVKLAQLPEEQQKEIEEAITTQQLDLTAENLDAYKETGDISELKKSEKQVQDDSQLTSENSENEEDTVIILKLEEVDGLEAVNDNVEALVESLKYGVEVSIDVKDKLDAVITKLLKLSDKANRIVDNALMKRKR